MFIIRLSDSKRIEAQLQEIEEKSEKKKMEVSLFMVYESITFAHLAQLVELQAELQQHQKKDGPGGSAPSA